MKTRTVKAARAKSTHQGRILNVLPSRDIQTDWKLENAVAAGAVSINANLPESVDLREPWWDIGDQGNTGSCVGWATADGVVRHQMVKTGKLAKKDHLSPRFVWMASKETDEIVDRPETFIEAAGTTLKSAMDVARKYGVPNETMLPLSIHTLMYTGRPDDLYAAASLNKIAGYVNLQKNLPEWKRWLAAGRPLLVAFNVDLTWINADKSGNLDRYQPDPAGNLGGHAVTLVGYTKDRFILRNSWGPLWGDRGFGYATVDYINQAFYNEAYGAMG